MFPHLLNALILIISLLLYLFACKVLIEDARKGYSITMGAEMYFSQLWMLASLLGIIGAIRLFQLSWWFFIPAIIILYILSIPVRRVIKVVFLGMDSRIQDASQKNSVGQENNE